jgi:hypothetical protein
MVTNDEIGEFMSLVDEARQNSSVDECTALEQAEARAIAESGPRSASNAVYARIHELIVRNDDVPGPNIRQLQGALTKRAELYPTFASYRDVVWRLRYGTSNDKRFRDFQDRIAWMAAIRQIDRLPMLLPMLLPMDPTRGLEREVAVATAVKKLRAHGYLIDPDNDGFTYRPGELERACADLNDKVAKIGGQRLIYMMLTQLRRTASIKNGRYLVCRPSRSLAGGDTDPSVPWGYLLNIAVKHLGANVFSENLDEMMRDIVDLATILVASMDVEHYYGLTPIFQTHATLPRYLREIILADHVLTFRQISAADGHFLIRGVFSWVDSTAMRARLGWGLEEAYELARKTILRIPGETINATFTRAALSAGGLSERVLDAMLPHFAHRSSEINARYLTPLDADKANALAKPFVMLPDGSLMAASPSIASIGFFETLASATRILTREADINIGAAMEQTLANAFSEHNLSPTVTSGKYRVGNEILECDLVVETKEAILFFELKKKALTGRSYAGDATTAFLDLCSSALAAQVQLGRHELRLRQTGKIEFLAGEVVRWDNRRIERFALSLLDWGGTQNRLVIQRISANLVGARLSASGLSRAQTEMLSSVHETLSELLTQRNRLEQLGVEVRDHFHNWWFSSMPQMLFALEEVSGPDEFYRDLRLIRQIHTGTMDFYRDLTSMRRAIERTNHNQPRG